MEKFSLRHAVVSLVIISAMVILYGCSDDGGSGSQINTGKFVDSHIEGIDYSTPTYTGTTDSQGTFKYQPGETVSFYVGGVYLGSTQGDAIITIVDFV